MDAKSIAKLFFDEIVCRYSAPRTLLSDQGAQFMFTLLKNICDYLKTKKINTTAYYPQCIGLTERFNATLCQILSMYIKNNQTDWDEYLKTALLAYNTSKQETTLMSPFEILNGREPRHLVTSKVYDCNEIIFKLTLGINGKRLVCVLKGK
jgi:hypothetical protein